MRRTAGLFLGLSVVGCQGLQYSQPTRDPNDVFAQIVGGQVQPGSTVTAGSSRYIPPNGPMYAQQGAPMYAQQGGAYYSPTGPGNSQGVLLPQASEPPLAAAGNGPGEVNPAGTVLARTPSGELRYVYANQVRPVPQPTPPLPPAAPPTVVQVAAPAPARSEDPAMRGIQMELTREMCQQIMELKQKVQELNAQAAAKAEPAKAPAAVRAEPQEAPRPAAPIPTPAPVAPAASAAPTTSALPAAPAILPAGFADAPSAADEAAYRTLHLEVTRELGHQVIELKQRMQEVSALVEAKAEAVREQSPKEALADMKELRLQVGKLQAELSRLKAPERAAAPRAMPTSTSTSTPTPTFPVSASPPPEPAPVAPPLMPRYKRPAVREGSALPQKDLNRKFSEGLGEVRRELESIKTRLQAEATGERDED